MLANDKKTPVVFTGNAREYFGIWIVNLLLSILTLGIYSAWAKVRRKKYFYQHTLIDGAGFDYQLGLHASLTPELRYTTISRFDDIDISYVTLDAGLKFRL